ncbi:MAG: N-carbamoylsarcosine amidase [Rhodospirillaceae bacterium]|nr:N-carbamoylsarcosine amidase [Rhodospirillaceae bacterium]|tara:strand:+ start:16511 stop:17125 length:615 start_codon:yes stop_codon:yes gene_type:complete
MTSENDVYEKQNFGNKLGFGNSPALLIVDFVNGFNDPNAFGGGNIPEAIETTKSLLKVAREKNITIAHTRVVFSDDSSDLNIMCKKVPSLKTLTEASESSQIVSSLTPLPGEIVIRKQVPSAFFGTNLAPQLTARGVDTVLVTGCTTSGCVRASALDAMCWGFMPIVVADACGDRAIGPHEANLFDLKQKYADVVKADEVIKEL